MSAVVRITFITLIVSVNIVSAQQVILEMTEAGFDLTDEPTTLNDQYLLQFKKKSQ